MIQHFLIHTVEGEIINCGTTWEDSLEQRIEGTTNTLVMLDDPLTHLNYFWKDGLQERPSAPEGNYHFDIPTETWIKIIDPEELTKAIISGVHTINSVAGSVRSTWITVSAGQEMIYLRKEREAIEYLSLDPAPTDLSNFPLLSAEVGITADDPNQLSQIWLNMANLWIPIAAAIEATRLAHINIIEAATDVSEVDPEITACITQLNTYRYSAIMGT